MALSGTLTTNAVQEGRYYTLSWTASQSIDNNQSTISWTLSCAGGVAWYAERTLTVVIAGETVYSKSARVERYAGTIASGTKVISHDSAGAASFSASIQAAVYTSSINCTASGSFTLDTIPRKSTLAISNADLGAKPTLTVTRKSSSFTHTITAKCGSNTVTICTKSSSTSITSWQLPISWAANNTTGTSVSVTYTITTYNGNTNIGSNTYTKTHAIPSSVAPSISSVTETDPEGYLASYGKYVSGLSKVAVSISASGSQGSTIKSYKTTIDGKTYTAASFTSSVLSGSGTLTISVTVTDSRGRTATSSKTISVYSYAKPKISNMSVKRSDSSGVSDSSGAYVTVTFNASVTSLDNQNTSEYKVRYKKKSDTDYTEIVLTDYGDSYSVSGGTVTFAADTSSSYDVIMIVSDTFNQDSVSGSAGTTSKVFSIFRRGLGIAFGKVAEIENAFEVGWNAIFNKPVRFRSTSYHARWDWSNTSTSVFFKIAKITIKGPYINVPIVLEFSARGSAYPVTVAITFESGDTTDPGLYAFLYFGAKTRKFYIVKTATSEWSLYCSSKQTYDSMLLDRYHFHYDTENEKYIEMEFIDGETVSSLPSGYVEASYLSIDAATLSGIGIRNTDGYGKTWPYIPVVKSDGVMEIGRYIDWHYSSGDSGDYTTRMWVNANGKISFAHGIENIKYDLIYNGGTNGVINFTPGNYDFLIVCGFPADGAASNAAHSVVVVPAKWYNANFQFSDETGWYKFVLYNTGISGRASGYGTIRRVYGVKIL